MRIIRMKTGIIIIMPGVSIRKRREISCAANMHGGEHEIVCSDSEERIRGSEHDLLLRNSIQCIISTEFYKMSVRLNY